MKSFGEKLGYLLKNKGITPYKLSRKTVISESTISRVINGKNEPNASTIASIWSGLGGFPGVFTSEELERLFDVNNQYPEGFDTVNKPDGNEFDYEAEEIWEIEEEGVSMTANGIEFRKLSNGTYEVTAPLVEEYAQAGYLAGYKDREYIEELPKHKFTADRIHKGIYRSFRVRGDSMCDGSRDSICEGDIVDGRKVHQDLWKNKLHFHSYPDFVIVHQDGVVVKRIVEHDVSNAFIHCISLNPDKSRFPNKGYSLTDVYELYNIISQEVKRKK